MCHRSMAVPAGILVPRGICQETKRRKWTVILRIAAGRRDVGTAAQTRQCLVSARSSRQKDEENKSLQRKTASYLRPQEIAVARRLYRR